MAYIYLGAAIITELAATSFLKMSEGFTRLWPTIATLILYGGCYFCFAKALLNINLSVAYATWCALGIIGATLLSVFLFRESLSFIGFIGILLIVAGVILLNLYGTSH